jgi:hypothetical protein
VTESVTNRHEHGPREVGSVNSLASVNNNEEALEGEEPSRPAKGF